MVVITLQKVYYMPYNMEKWWDFRQKIIAPFVFHHMHILQKYQKMGGTFLFETFQAKKYLWIEQTLSTFLGTIRILLQIQDATKRVVSTYIASFPTRLATACISLILYSIALYLCDNITIFNI